MYKQVFQNPLLYLCLIYQSPCSSGAPLLSILEGPSESILSFPVEPYTVIKKLVFTQAGTQLLVGFRATCVWGPPSGPFLYLWLLLLL